MSHILPSSETYQVQRKSKQVFVTVEGQAHRTFALTLQGGETLPEIKTKVQSRLGGLPEHTFTLTSQGTPLSLPHIKQDATLRVCLSGGLCGGSSLQRNVSKKEGEKKQQQKVFATIVRKDAGGKPLGEPFILEEDCKICEMKKQYQASNSIQQENSQYVFAFGGHTFRDADEDKLLSDFTQSLTQTEKPEITVVLKAKKNKAPEEAFLEMVPFVKDATIREQMKKFLSESQKSLMARFDQEESNDHDLDHELHMTLILSVLSEQQTENILNDLLRSDKDETLKYLMKKHNKWSEISEKMLINSSDAFKDQQIRHLLGSYQNRFEEGNKFDKMFSDLIIKSEHKFRLDILKGLSQSQLVELFMQVLNQGQRAKIFTILQQNHVQGFWELLNKERRLSCFSDFQPDFKIDFIIGENYLDKDIKRRLWDNLQLEGRNALWAITKDQKVTQGTGRLLQKQLLEQLSIQQRTRFWINTPVHEQVAFLEIVSEVTKSKDLWTELDYKRRCLMMEQLSDEKLIDFFKSMQLEYRTQIITMVDAETRGKLESSLPDKEKDELFFYEHFAMKEKTDYTPNQFVENLLKDYYDKNNQEVPFERIDDGFVQVIRNTYVKSGFITVQVVEPKFKTSNYLIDFEEDSMQQHLETDEARAEGHLFKSQQNDNFRMNQNRFGQLEEETPVMARNAKKLAIISFVEYFEEYGIQCTHAFFVANPIVFADISRTLSKTVLFTGRNGEIFFFNVKGEEELSTEMKSAATSSSLSGEVFSVDDEKLSDFQLQILLSDAPSKQGESSRDVTDNCIATNIPSHTKLAAFIRSTQSQLINNPSLTQHLGRNYLVFTLETTTYLFDTVVDKEVLEMPDTVAFIGLISEKGKQKDKSSGKKAIMTCLRTSKEGRRKQSSYSVSVSLMEFTNHNKETDSFDVDIESTPIIDYPLEYNRLPKHQNLRSLEIEPTQINENTGTIESFIMLFKTDKALTFTLSSSYDTQKQNDEAKRQESKLSRKSGMDSDKKSAKSLLKHSNRSKTLTRRLSVQERGNSKTSAQMTKNSMSQEFQGLQEAEKEVVEKFGEKKDGEMYRCKYEVLQAEQIVKDYSDGEKVKTYVQVYPQQLENVDKASEERIQYSVMLYNVTDHEIKNNKTCIVPQERRFDFPIRIEEKIKSRDLLKCLTPVPVIFDKERVIGGSLYKIERPHHHKIKLQWFDQHNSFNRALHNVEPGDQQDSYIQKQERIIDPAHQTKQVDYPLMVYKGFAPDNRELVLANLADSGQPQKIIHLVNLQFLCFVGHNFATREARVGFLAFDKEMDINLCWITNKKPFKKNKITDMTDYKLSAFKIPFSLPILQELNTIKKIEFIKDPSELKGEGVLVVQTETSIYALNISNGNYEVVTDSAAPIMIQRGYNSHFYYVIHNSVDMSLLELTLKKKSGLEWKCYFKEIYVVREGKILAVELDQLNRDKIDSSYTYSNQVKDENREAVNKLYLMDDKENLLYIRQKHDHESGDPYQIVEEKDLADLKGFNLQLATYKERKFNSIVVTDRVISINDHNYNFFNGKWWKFNEVPKLQKRKSQQNQINVILDDSEEHEQNEDIKRSETVYVEQIQGIPWTSRLMMTCQFEEKIEGKDGEEKYQHIDKFVTKILPGTRRLDLVGLKGLRDTESVNMIADDLCLYKFRSTNVSGNQDYWTLINQYGQIQPLPENSEKHLTWSNFSSGQSKLKNTGTTLVLRGGEQPVISTIAFSEFKEDLITVIEFSRVGQVTYINSFSKDSYSTHLKELIEDKLHEQKKMLGSKELTGQDYKDIAESLRYSDEMLCTSEGDLYRVATITDSRFIDDAAINPIDSFHNVTGSPEPDVLSMGLFKVESNLQFDTSYERLKVVEKNLNIILFICQSDQSRFLLHNSSLAVVGNQFCWSYPQEKGISIIDMDKISSGKVGVTTGMRRKGKNVIHKVKSAISDRKRSRELQKAATRDAADNHRKEEKKEASNSVKTKSRGEQLLDPSKTIDAGFDNPFDYDPNEESILSNQVFQKGIDTTRNILLDKDKKAQVIRQASLPRQPEQIELSVPPMIEEESKPEHLTSEKETEVALINWIKLETRTINLSDFHVEEADALKMIISEVPYSTTLSVIRGKQGKENKFRENMLQVTIQDRIMIFDISQKKAQEIFFLNATSQLIGPEKYVDPGITMAQCINIEKIQSRDSFLFIEVKHNRRKDFNMITQKRKVYSKNINWDNIPRTIVCTGVFKTYAEADLQELAKISVRIENHNKIKGIDIQTILSTFDNHTMFSIFDTNVPVHEQMVEQIAQEEFSDDEMEDETLLENNQLRRLYRILTLPTPQIIDPDSRDSVQSKSTQNQVTTTAEKDKKLTKIDPLPNISERVNQQENYLYRSQTIKSLLQIDKSSNLEKNTAKTQLEEETEEENKKKTGLNSVLFKSLYSENVRIKECLLSIVNKCDEGNISSFCENQEDFTILLEKLSSGALDLITSSFLSTPFTVMIESCKWNRDTQKLTFRMKGSLVTKQKVENKIYEKVHNSGYCNGKYVKGSQNDKKANPSCCGGEHKDLPTTQIKVRMLPLDWLYNDGKNFVDFVGILKKASNEQIYDTELISTLLCEFWFENFIKIRNRVLLPWIVYALLVCFFFSYALKPIEEGEEIEDRKQVEYAVGGSALILLFYHVYVNIRIYQHRAASGLPRIKSVSDLIEWFQYLSSIYIISIHLLQPPEVQEPRVLERQRILAAFTTLALWIKVFDWCKLFQQTSFFIRLLSETINDIKYFMVLFFVALAMFGMPMYMLQLNRTQDNALVNEVFGEIWPLNLVYNQYMLSLGEFNMENFDDNPQTILCYFFFLCATFFTQITFLNMLIALMGDTFGRVIESKERFGLQTKLDIMADYTAMIKSDSFGGCCGRRNSGEQNKVYMFVVNPYMGDDEDDTNWEGNISSIKKSVEKSIAIVGTKVENQYKNMLDQGLETKTRDSSLMRGAKENYNKIVVQINQLSQEAHKRHTYEIPEKINGLYTQLRVEIEHQTRLQKEEIATSREVQQKYMQFLLSENEKKMKVSLAEIKAFIRDPNHKPEHAYQTDIRGRQSSSNSSDILDNESEQRNDGKKKRRGLHLNDRRLMNSVSLPMNQDIE